MTHSFIFLDSGREPQCPSNPAYPNGKHVRAAGTGRPTCEVKLPYPAPRCGVMVVKCDACGLSVGLTVAGRPDDPCTVQLECNDVSFKVAE